MPCFRAIAPAHQGLALGLRQINAIALPARLFATRSAVATAATTRHREREPLRPAPPFFLFRFPAFAATCSANRPFPTKSVKMRSASRVPCRGLRSPQRPEHEADGAGDHKCRQRPILYRFVDSALDVAYHVLNLVRRVACSFHDAVRTIVQRLLGLAYGILTAIVRC